MKTQSNTSIDESTSKNKSIKSVKISDIKSNPPQPNVMTFVLLICIVILVIISFGKAKSAIKNKYKYDNLQTSISEKIADEKDAIEKESSIDNKTFNAQNWINNISENAAAICEVQGKTSVTPSETLSYRDDDGNYVDMIAQEMRPYKSSANDVTNWYSCVKEYTWSYEIAEISESNTKATVYFVARLASDNSILQVVKTTFDSNSLLSNVESARTSQMGYAYWQYDGYAYDYENNSVPEIEYSEPTVDNTDSEDDDVVSDVMNLYDSIKDTPYEGEDY